MADKAWKSFEREVARLISGRRFWSNSGEAIDCEGPGYIAQAKLVRTCSLEALTQLAEQVERQAAVRDKVGVVAIKRRRGHGRPSPMLLVLTGAAWERLNGSAQNRRQGRLRAALSPRRAPDPWARPSRRPLPRSTPERTGPGGPVVGSPEPVGVVCGGLRSPLKQAACSAACRTALNRKRKADAERRQKAEVVAFLEAALNRLREGP